LAPLPKPPSTLFIRGDPLLEEPHEPAQGPYFDAEAFLVGPHLQNRLSGQVTSSTGVQSGPFHVPAADLNWTVSPRFEIGYRLPDGFGEFEASYRFLLSDGAVDLLSDLGTVHSQSRLTVHVFDFDYANRQPLGSHWDLRGKVGVRLADVFFDSRSQQAVTDENFGAGTLDQHASSNFLGAGPLAGLELFRKLGLPGLALYGKVEGSSLWGRIHQTFQQQFSFGGVPNPALGGKATDGRSQGVGTLQVQLGVNWVPAGQPSFRFFLGYQWQQWYQVGRDDNSSPIGSKGELTENGIFFRGEIDF
jgi:hypothetical protein